ncbi:Putative 30S ribosomal protein S17P-like protein [Fusarium oxysporum f. sp. cubense race 1]|uniref:Putative 30S ribosomal protein S17P-like protein n=1 Tax=Fusarium oxysporum f. sp. cubense (strain race 1) TaxID=1229664 RepID=N4U545_FUSC1|nr:Putative 30S ribosomal protein S17P-like protein [Fusarium oxysporum f. sp. cubense race 1]
MPRDHHDRAAYLDDLGVALGDRFSITRNPADLDEAIQISREAVNMTPVDSPDRAGRLSNCGIRLAEKYSVTEEMSDLKDAIGIMREVLEVTPSDDPDRAMYMNNLGTALADQYAQTSKMADLNESIHITQQAIDAAVEDYSDRPMYLNSLALRLGDRYVRTGEGADLDNALSIIRDAINSAPDDSPDRGLYLNTLVIQLGRQYARTGAMADLQESVRVAHDIVDTSLNDPDRPMYLNNLGLALGELYSVAYEDSDIDNAILALREALGLSPEESTSRAIHIHNLGIQFGRKYSKTGATADLQECLRHIRKAIKSVTADHPDRAGWLSNLGVRLGEGYLRGDSSADIEEAIRVTQEAIKTTKVTTDKVTYLCKALLLNSLGVRLAARYTSVSAIDDLESAIEMTKRAVEMTPKISLICDALEVAVSLIPKLTARSLENPDKQHLLGQVVGLASNAAAAALNAGRGPTAALKFLEQGRGVLATSLEEMRMDVIELQARYPELAKRFVSLRDELDSPVARDTFNQDDHGGFNHQARATRRYDAGNKLDEVIAEIQRQPGFEDFLAAPSEAELKASASCGPIVVINTTRNRDPGKIDTLEWLWDTVAHPILDALGFTYRHDESLEKWPRIWWVATGIMTKFPLHAAGRHDAESASVLDRVMSSYSSSIKTIIQSRRRGHGEAKSTMAQALLVAMKHTPEQSSLPFAAREIEVIRDLVKTMQLEPIEPGQHKHDIMAHLPQCKVFHFAGHGHTDGHDPMRSRLLLEDGKENPLTVANLLEINLRKHLPFLAYLSACGTGRIKDKRFVDESIHLVSACQLAGFRHVIGTLWEVNDELCVDMARITYEGMRDGAMIDESVCEGLHNATRQLRDRWRNMPMNSVARSATDGDRRPRDIIACDDETSPLHWVPYVHFGV